MFPSIYRNRIVLSAVLLLLGSTCSPVARAATMVLPPVADTSLQQAFPDNNMGASTTLFSGTRRKVPTTGRTRSLLRFDVAGNLPADATITSAALTVVVTRTPSAAANSNFELRRVLRSWNEGDKTDGTATDTGLPASLGEATWNAPWSTGGGAAGTDYASAISSVVTIGVNGGHTFPSTTTLVADVQNMLTNPAANFGWVFQSQSEGTATTIRRFGSREGGISVAASLAVDFEEPPPPGTSILTGAADTSLFESDPDNNLGGMTFVPIGVNGLGGKARGLFKFDVAGALPANAVVDSAALNLTVSHGVAGAFQYDLHRLLVDWGEGNKSGGGDGSGDLGAPAAAGEATWKARLSPSTLWSTPGAAPNSDFVSASSATVTIQNLGGVTITSAALASDVQQWVADSASNFGWIMILQNELLLNGSARRFSSRENPVASERPTLTVTWSLPFRVENPRVAGDTFQFDFQSAAGKSYVVQSREAFSAATPWMTLTNISLQAAAGTITVSDSLTPFHRFYRVEAQ
jgi:hypothetical protein